MTHEFNIRIVRFDETVYDGKAVHCRVRTEVGSLGLKARHEPFIAALEPGSSIEIQAADGQTLEFKASGAMLEFRDNWCTILLAQ